MALSRTELDAALTQLQRGDWRAAHEIVQKDEDSALACWAHGIVHIMEGDIANARYWYVEAKRSFPVEPDAGREIRALALAIAEKR